jgi:hypothetical protein
VKFQLIEPLSKTHNIVIYIYSSTACIAEFLKLVRRRILLNNRTKWNSWYTILVIALKLRLAVEKYF